MIHGVRCHLGIQGIGDGSVCQRHDSWRTTDFSARLAHSCSVRVMANESKRSRSERTLTQESFARLLDRARVGSRSALDRLLASCLPWLQRRARRALPRDLAAKQGASDNVQECLVAATDKLAEFRGEDLPAFRNWLTAILDNQLLQAIRFWGKRRRELKRGVPLDVNDDRCRGWEPVSSSPSVFDRLIRQEELDRLMRLLSWFRDEDRTVIIMRLENQSHEDIAAGMGSNVDAVRKRFSRALPRISRAMKLLELMDQRRIGGPQQEAIGLHYVQRATPAQIAQELLLPEDLVARWISAAKPLFRDAQGNRT
jgi:RNA polymerase sigma factor (sigma-70 family)